MGVDELNALGVSAPNRRSIGVVSQVGATALGDFDLNLRSSYSEEGERDSAAKEGNFLYVVADAGIGCALINKGRLFHGVAVPSIGHSIVHLHEDTAPISCEFHGRRPCLNSVASLDAISKRWGHDASITDDGWRCKDPEKVALIANYIAQAVSNVIYFASPKQIVIGGRIENNPYFLELFRANLASILGVDDGKQHDGYSELHDLETFVRGQSEFASWQPQKGLDLHAGVRGAIQLVEQWLPTTKDGASDAS